MPCLSRGAQDKGSSDVDAGKQAEESATATDSTWLVSVRDRLLVKEVAELEVNLPCMYKVHFPDPNKLHCFQLTVTPGNTLTCVNVKVIFRQQILKIFQVYNCWFDLSSNFL